MRGWRWRSAGVWVIGVLFCAPALASKPPGVPDPSAVRPEQRLVMVVRDMRAGHLDRALKEARALIREQPNFHLAQLLYGDLLAAKAGRAPGTLRPEQSAEIQGLMQEANLRLEQARLAPPQGYVPSAVLALAPRQEFAIVVDLARSRLYILKNDHGFVRVVRSMYATIGKNGAGKELAGYKRTPIGVYHTTRFLSGRKLPDIYGAGAFPLNYPNAWDQRAGRTGYGIWLHGVPGNTYSRLPRASQGCVAVANANLLSLKPYITPDVTPVVFSNHLTWEPKQKALNQRADFLLTLEKWRQDWESGNAAAYFSHYAPDFTTAGMSHVDFVQHRRKMLAGRTSVHVKLTDLSLFSYPGVKDLMMATFTQHYRSGRDSRVTRRRQFWRRDAQGKWRIIYAYSIKPQKNGRPLPGQLSAQLMPAVFGNPRGGS